MSLNLKFRTCFIAFILVFSSFSFLFINPNIVKAQDPSEEDWREELAAILAFLGSFFENVLRPHPYRIVGVYNVNETLNITGDVVFDLYFFSTLLTQLGASYRDKINVSLHYVSAGDGTATQIGNESIITLEPEVSDEIIQKQDDVKIKDISHTLYKGDYLLISIELIQSEKPIAKFIEQRYERKIKGRLETIANLLNSSEDPELSDIGGAIKEILSMLEEFGIEPNDIADLANSFRSSSFYYGSSSYKSSVSIPLSDSEDSKTLYFHNLPDYTFDVTGLGFTNFKTVNEIKPSGDIDYIWPPLLISTSETEIGIEEWLSWFLIWLVYVMEGQPAEDENTVTYYLSKESKLVLSEPEGDSPSRIQLSKDSINWTGISLDRNKIIKNATAELYLYYPRIILLRKINVNATLYDETEKKIIGSDEQEIDRTSIIELLQRGPDSPTLFTFEEAKDEEIWNGHDISLTVSVSQEPLFSLLRSTILLCDSNNYPSSVTLNLKETDNIKISEDLEDKKIIPGGSAEYIINITSMHADTVKIDVSINNSNNPDHWRIEHPASVKIDEGGYASVQVSVISTENSSSAYVDFANLIFNVTGKTGFDKDEAKVTVSTDAVDVNFEVIKPKNKEIKHGEKGAYKFIIRNMNNGFLTDTYKVNAASEHGWILSYAKMIYDLEPYVLNGKEYVLYVNISIPKNTDISSDELEIIISSEEARIKNESKVWTGTVTTKVIGPNILEMIYSFFESVAEDLGLDEILGSYAAAFLLFIVLFIILIFVIVIVYLVRKKFVEIVCLDRIKDITTDEEAKFDITLQNPSKKTLSYEIHTEMESEAENWDISLDKESVIVEPKQSSVVVLTVKPTDYVKSDDWIEVRVIAKVVEKKKSSEISTVTTIKDGKPEVKIAGVVHWPKVFKKGDRVETSFRLRNEGNVSASNINVILYVNGKEKNKVEDITIPRGGYAEIEIPWIAVKGKNKVSIVVK
jgi:uncharacterized membrane protein (Fun14 family)